MSLAKVITVANHAIAVDWGMLKILDTPVLERLEIQNNPKFKSVLPDVSVPISMHASTPSAAAAPITTPAPDDSDAPTPSIIELPAPPDPVSSPPPAAAAPPAVSTDVSPDDNGNLTDDSMPELVSASETEESDSEIAGARLAPPAGAQPCPSPAGPPCAVKPPPPPVPRDEFDAALERCNELDATGDYVMGVTLSQAFSRGVEGLSSREVRDMITDAKNKPARPRPVRAKQPIERLNPATDAPQSKTAAAPKRKPTSQQLVLVPPHIFPDYECDENDGAGWTAEVVRKSAKAAVLRWVNWRGENGEEPATVALDPSVLLPYPASTAAEADDEEEEEHMPSLATLAAMVEQAHIEPSTETTTLGYYELVDVETGEHFLAVCAQDGKGDGTDFIVSMGDPSTFPLPQNEREYKLSPHRAYWDKLREKKFARYQELNISKLVRRQRGMKVLRGRWVYAAKYNPSTGEFEGHSVRWAVVGTPMDRDVYKIAADCCRHSTIYALIAITVVYRLHHEIWDLEQAFQTTPTDKSEPPIFVEQIQGFAIDPSVSESVANLKEGAELQGLGRPGDWVQQLEAGVQGTLNGSRLLMVHLHTILTDEANCVRCPADRRAYMYYSGPPARSLDEVVQLRDAGKLDGDGPDGRPLGFFCVGIHGDDMPPAATSQRLLDYIRGILAKHFTVKIIANDRLLGCRLTWGDGFCDVDQMQYLQRVAQYHLDPVRYRGSPKPPHVASKLIEKSAELMVAAEPPPEGTPEFAAHVQMQADAKHLAGCLGWATSEHPKLVCVHSMACQAMAGFTVTHYGMLQQALAHQLAYPDAKRVGAPDIKSLILSDAPIRPLSNGPQEAGLYAIFDSSPRNPRSHTGVAVMLARVSIDHVCAREKTKTAGAHAGETAAAIQALHRIEPLRLVLEFFMVPQDAPTPLWTDAQSVLFSSTSAWAVRHTPWLLARLEALLDAVDRNQARLLKLPGNENPTNSFTKYTVKPECMRDMAFLANYADGFSALTQQDDLRGVVAAMRAFADEHVPATINGIARDAAATGKAALGAVATGYVDERYIKRFKRALIELKWAASAVLAAEHIGDVTKVANPQRDD